VALGPVAVVPAGKLVSGHARGTIETIVVAGVGGPARPIRGGEAPVVIAVVPARRSVPIGGAVDHPNRTRAPVAIKAEPGADIAADAEGNEWTARIGGTDR